MYRTIITFILAFSLSIFVIVKLTPQPETIVYQPLPPVAACRDCLSGTHNAVGVPIGVTVNLMDSEKEVAQQHKNLRFTEIDSPVWSEWVVVNNKVECTIYGVHPRTIDDPNLHLLALHLLHCVLGQYR